MIHSSCLSRNESPNGWSRITWTANQWVSLEWFINHYQPVTVDHDRWPTVETTRGGHDHYPLYQLPVYLLLLLLPHVPIIPHSCFTTMCWFDHGSSSTLSSHQPPSVNHNHQWVTNSTARLPMRKRTLSPSNAMMGSRRRAKRWSLGGGMA